MIEFGKVGINVISEFCKIHTSTSKPHITEYKNWSKMHWYICYRDGTIQGTGVLMHHPKSIMIPQYIMIHHCLLEHQSISMVDAREQQYDLLKYKMKILLQCTKLLFISISAKNVILQAFMDYTKHFIYRYLICSIDTHIETLCIVIH